MSELKEYLLPYDWKISFPKEWAHEFEPYPEGDQHLFYPQDSDLTFRINSFCIQNESGYAPIKVLSEVFCSSCRKSKLKRNKTPNISGNNYFSEYFKGITKENGKKIHWVSIGIMIEGFLLKINIFGENNNSIERALCYIKTINKV